MILGFALLLMFHAASFGFGNGDIDSPSEANLASWRTATLEIPDDASGFKNINSRVLFISEAVGGLLFIAVIVSRVISDYSPHADEAKNTLAKADGTLAEPTGTSADVKSTLTVSKSYGPGKVNGGTG